MRNQLTWENVITPASANSIAGWDGSGDAAVLTFNNGLDYTGGLTFGLGGELSQNTLIDGASFDLQLGTFLTSPMDSFQSYAGTHFWSSRNTGTGEIAGLTLNSDLQLGLNSDGGKFFIQHLTAQSSLINGVETLNRLGTNTNSPGSVRNVQINTTGTADAGLGMFDQTDIETTDGTTWMAMQEEVVWEVATTGAEYSQWRKLLTLDHDPVEVYKIETNPDILHTFTGLIMMADLPAADPGIPGRLYHTAGAVMVSL